MPEKWIRAIYSPDHRGEDFIEAVVSYDGDLRIHVHTGSFFEWEIFFKGYYEEYVVRLIKSHVFPGNICLDVGANIGSDTLVMAKQAGAAGRVYAFEPNPDYFGRLRQNLELNGMSNVVPLMKALDISEGRSDLYVSDGPVKTASQVMASEGYVRRGTVETTTARSAIGVLPACDFIKIDVDGTEGRILEGLADILKAHRPYVLFEYSEDAWAKADWTLDRTLRLFRELEYRSYQAHVDGTLSELGDVPSYANIFCVPLGRPV